MSVGHQEPSVEFNSCGVVCRHTNRWQIYSNLFTSYQSLAPRADRFHAAVNHFILMICEVVAFTFAKLS